MKKRVIIIGLLLSLSVTIPVTTHANPIVVVVKAIVKKVIKALDLAVQRIQNETIRLQNAQKVLENALSKLKLQEIGGWVEKQRDQYAQYFDELQQVKLLITYYHRAKDILQKQAAIVAEYQRAYNLFKHDRHFTPEELLYMAEVYNGMLDASVKNLDQLALVINAFKTQMSDAKRLQIIDDAAASVDKVYHDLQAFNNQNKLLSLQRAKNADEVNVVKKMYGLP